MRKRLFSIIVLFVGLLFPNRILGQEQALRLYTVQDVPNVHLQDSTHFVSDPNDYITAEEEENINHQIAALRRQYQMQFAVVVLPSLSEDIEGFSNKLFRSWGIGRKEFNDGLLFVLAVEDRKSRFEVGQGLEGYLTDAITSTIWRRDMRPLVAEGSYGEALSRGVAAVAEELAYQEYAPGKAPQGTTIDWTTILWFYLGAVIVIFVFVVLNLKTSASQSYRTLTDARIAYTKQIREYNKALKFLLIVCLPIGLLLRALKSYFLGKLETIVFTCSHCRGKDTVKREKPQLQQLESIEARLGVATFDAYCCSACQKQELIRVYNKSYFDTYKQCPSCHGRTSVLIKSVQYRKASDKLIYRNNTYECLYCKHRYNDDNIDKSANAEEELLSAGTGMIIGSMLGGRGRSSGGSWGGGFGGGSWGGGSSAGGGSTGSW